MNNIIFTSLHNLKNVGEKTKPRLNKLLSRILEKSDIKIIDILHNKPRYYIDRSKIYFINTAPLNHICTFIVDIVKISKASQKYIRTNLPIILTCKDQTGFINLQFFGKHTEWINEQFKVNDKIIVSGKTNLYKNYLTITHPDYILDIEKQHLLPKIEPVYTLSQGISNKMYQKYVNSTLEVLPNFEEWIDKATLEKYNFVSYKEAITNIHKPKNLDLNNYIKRLAYDELLAHQIGHKLLKPVKTHKLEILKFDDRLKEKIEKLLPFQLTSEQNKAFTEIKTHLSNTTEMSCLLQGDVGCGKTIIAALTMAHIASLNFQSALMAPTEVLARQHYEKLNPLFEKLGFKCVILTRYEKGKEKTKITNAIKNGEVQIIIGTHALLANNIIFKNLALTVIDEQHRFGVEQRATLLNKSIIAHLLIMTATPIPRTLVLTEFGETNIVQIKHKPKERKPIITKLLSINKIENLIERIKVVVETGAKIYWICPLIEESESLELMDTFSRYDYLQNFFKDKVGIIHGKQSNTEKEKFINKFKESQIQILVSTTVIEVGIDIPDATIMIIEHAERFGLSQLHQLRGRVGRSNKNSSCVLLYKNPLSIIAQQRLDIMINSQDGFYIAEKDLALRGEGDIFGNRQSGTINFIFANLAIHLPLLEQARNNIAIFNTQNLSLLKIYSTVTDFAKLRG